MPGYEWDESEWPLVRVKVHPTFTPVDQEGMFVRFRQMLERKTRCVLVHDSRQAPPASAVARQRVVQAMGELEPLATRYMAGVAVVLSSTVQRGILTAILWVRPAPYPLQVVATVEAGEAWARERLNESPRSSAWTCASAAV